MSTVPLPEPLSPVMITSSVCRRHGASFHRCRGDVARSSQRLDVAAVNVEPLGFDQIEMAVAPPHQHGDAFACPRRDRPGNRVRLPFRAALLRASSACAVHDDSTRKTLARAGLRACRCVTTSPALAGADSAVSRSPPVAPHRRAGILAPLGALLHRLLFQLVERRAHRREQVAYPNRCPPAGDRKTACVISALCRCRSGSPPRALLFRRAFPPASKSSRTSRPASPAAWRDNSFLIPR